MKKNAIMSRKRYICRKCNVVIPVGHFYIASSKGKEHVYCFMYKKETPQKRG